MLHNRLNSPAITEHPQSMQKAQTMKRKLSFRSGLSGALTDISAGQQRTLVMINNFPYITSMTVLFFKHHAIRQLLRGYEGQVNLRLILRLIMKFYILPEALIIAFL